MTKVITLSGMKQSSSLKGWDKCAPVEVAAEDGTPVIRCGDSKAITLSGGGSCKPAWKKMKNGKRRCRCGNRFVKSELCSRKA